MRMVSVFFVVAVMTAGTAAHSQDYYPLDVGNVWFARVFTFISGTETVDGTDYYVIRSSINSWLERSDGEGKIYRKHFDADESLYLDTRANIGDSWEFTIRAHIDGDIYDDDVYVVTLADTTETVETPLGVFTHCYHYTFRCRTAYDADYDIWLAPGFGTVKTFSTSWGSGSVIEKAIIGGQKYPADDGLEILRFFPRDKITDAPIDTEIIVWFSYPINPDCIDSRSFAVTASVSGTIAGTVGLDWHDVSRIRFVPDSPLPYGETITVTLSPDIADTSGDSAGLTVFSFVTENDPVWNWFRETESIVPSTLDQGSFDWGDYDNDGDEDFIVTGQDSYYETFVEFYENNNGEYVLAGNIFGDDLRWGPVRWIDYNSDGWLDLVMCGRDDKKKRLTFFYRNDNGRLLPDERMTLDIESNYMRWCDYDSDGYPDCAIYGYRDGIGKFYEVYHNLGNSMERIDMPGMPTCEVPETILWLDVNGNSLPDLLIVGEDYDGNTVNRLFVNDGGGFVERQIPGLDELRSVREDNNDTADIDGDGDTDFIIGGDLWITDEDVFIHDQRGVEELSYPVAAFSDRDSDGDPDLFVMGAKYKETSGWKDYIQVYENHNGYFTLIQETRLRKNISHTDGRWKDIDGDGALDLVVMDYLEGLLLFKNHMPSGSLHADSDTPRSEPPILSPYPNPFNASVSIEFRLGDGGRTELDIYSVTGQRIRRLVDGDLPAGRHRVVWDGTDSGGRTVSSGLYIVSLRSGAQVVHSKVMFVR